MFGAALQVRGGDVVAVELLRLQRRRAADQHVAEAGALLRGVGVVAQQGQLAGGHCRAVHGESHGSVSS